mmetsp:Transcript_78107/g.198490  ORF Transcript_78107/g.198490 Transcript_78107/m.198490 type:complete len:219 (-) Transcript_78107:33-689(-)
MGATPSNSAKAPGSCSHASFRNGVQPSAAFPRMAGSRVPCLPRRRRSRRNERRNRSLRAELFKDLGLGRRNNLLTSRLTKLRVACGCFLWKSRRSHDRTKLPLRRRLPEASVIVEPFSCSKPNSSSWFSSSKQKSAEELEVAKVPQPVLTVTSPLFSLKIDLNAPPGRCAQLAASFARPPRATLPRRTPAGALRAATCPSEQLGATNKSASASASVEA